MVEPVKPAAAPGPVQPKAPATAQVEIPKVTMSYSDKQLMPTLQKHLQFSKMAGASAVTVEELEKRIDAVRVWQEKNKAFVK